MSEIKSLVDMMNEHGKRIRRLESAGSPKIPYIVIDNAACDGVTDDAPVIQAAIDVAKSMSTNETKPIVYLPPNHYYLFSGITIYCGETSLQGSGSILDFSGVTDGTVCVTIEQDSYTYRRHNYSLPSMDGVTLIGNSKTGTSIGIFANESSPGHNQNPDIRNIAIDSFGTGVKIGDNTWGVQFLSSDIVNCSVAIEIVAGSVNNGERISFINCLIAENTNVIINDGNGKIHFTNCAFDYNDEIMASGAGSAAIFFTSCHLESTWFPWFTITTGSLYFSDCVLWYAGVSTLDGIVNFTPATNYLGPLVSFTNCWVVSSGAIVRLTTGTGRVRAKGISYASNTLIDPLSITCAAANACSDGGFESDGLGWTLTGCASSVEQAYSGTKSLKMFNGQDAAIVLDYHMGALISGEFWVYATAAGNYYLLAATFNCLSHDGTVLGTITANRYSPLAIAINTWTQVGFTVDDGIVPQGTEQIVFGFSHWLGGGVIFYVDDVVVNIYE